MVHRAVAALSLALLAIAGCRWPDYVWFGAGVGQTSADFKRGLDQEYDGDSYGVSAGIGFDIGERRRSRNEDADRERALYAARAARGEVEPLAADHSVHIDLSDETRVDATAEVEAEIDAGTAVEVSPEIEVDASLESAVEVDVQDEADEAAGDESGEGEEDHGVIPEVPDDIEGSIGIIAWGIALLLAALAASVLVRSGWFSRNRAG